MNISSEVKQKIIDKLKHYTASAVWKEDFSEDLWKEKGKPWILELFYHIDDYYFIYDIAYGHIIIYNSNTDNIVFSSEYQIWMDNYVFLGPSYAENEGIYKKVYPQHK